MKKFIKKKTLGIKRRAGGHMIRAAKSPIPSSACAVACPMTEENAKTVLLENPIMTTPPNPLLVLTEEGQTSAFHDKSACSAWWAKFGHRFKSAYDLSEAMAPGFELEDENVACTVELAGLLLGRVHKAVIAGLLRRRMQETGMSARDWIYIELLEDAVCYLMTPPEQHRLASLPDEVVVFRLQGTGRPRIPSGLSWTTNRTAARNFAGILVNKYQDAILLRTTVSKEDITALFDRSDEVIINADLIKVEKVEIVERIFYQKDRGCVDC